jgi:hypothetical protein
LSPTSNIRNGNLCKSVSQIINAGFEVLTAVTMGSSIFCDIRPCSSAKSTDVSEEHNEDRRVSKA